MRRRLRGLTLAELLIAFVLVLLLLLYTISSFVASHNYLKRGKEYSTSLFLSQTKMEELQVTPVTDIEAEEGSFPPPFENYRYRIDFRPWEGELQQLHVRVTSPRGAVARVFTLRQSQAYQGVVADPATNTVAFTRPTSAEILYWDDVNKTLIPNASKPLTSGSPGGLTGHPGHGYLWTVNTDSNTLVPYDENNLVRPWGAEVGFPALTGLGPVRLSGIATDSFCNLVYASDWSNRGLWIYSDGLPGYGKGFIGGRPHAPVSPPLGIPSGVATDPSGSVCIVADTENQCLRKLFINLSAPSIPPPDYPAEDLEEARGIGFWHSKRLRHPKGMGAPQGVAVNSTGWVVYAVDRAYLYQLIENSPNDFQWERFPLPQSLTQSSPSGLALDEYNNLLFISTRNGELWRFEIDNARFDPLVSAGGSGA